jgi:hypothetical protein
LKHKKKGRLRCHKRPKSREETPKEGSDSGVGLGVATAYPQLRRSRSAAQLNVRVTDRYQGLWRSPSRPSTSANGSFSDLGPRARDAGLTPVSGHRQQAGYNECLFDTHTFTQSGLSSGTSVTCFLASRQTAANSVFGGPQVILHPVAQASASTL